MPELPEVETIKNSLAPKLVNQKITAIKVLNPKSFQADPKHFLGSKIINLWRRAKILGIDFDNGLSLVIHLKMSGQLIFEDSGKRLTGGHPTQDMFGQMPNKSTRVIFELAGPADFTLNASRFTLYFNDQRKFGWIKGMLSSELGMQNYGLKIKLGPEPLGADFTWQTLHQNLQRRKNQPIKVAILDQEVVAGVGNIYASEACFLAGINPQKLVKNLSSQEIKKLHQAIITALKLGIKHGGSSMTHFFDSNGNKGYFLKYASVYNLSQKPCKKCQNLILKITQAGRGTYYCKNCQK